MPRTPVTCREVFWHMIMLPCWATWLLLSMRLKKHGCRARWAAWQASYILRTLPRGTKIPQSCTPIRFPKCNGFDGHTWSRCLMHCFYRVTHCPWCRKVGQNEGTAINHLQTVHYRLGLMCKKCHSYPSTSLEAICHHGQKECQPLGEGGADESSSLA